MLENVREQVPLVHNITNYVTVNDVANALLACGASPIMSDEPNDVEDITSICGGLNINIGTLNQRSIEGMFLAGKKAAEWKHPILLDPVGAGASKLRTETALKLMKELPLSAIRGNISEIKTLALGSSTTKGVDANLADAVTEENLDSMVAFAKEFASQTGAVIAITGAIDLVADAGQCYVIRNGRPEMSRITGTGCQLSGVMTAFLTANPGNHLDGFKKLIADSGSGFDSGKLIQNPAQLVFQGFVDLGTALNHDIPIQNTLGHIVLLGQAREPDKGIELLIFFGRKTETEILTPPSVMPIHILS